MKATVYSSLPAFHKQAQVYDDIALPGPAFLCLTDVRYGEAMLEKCLSAVTTQRRTQTLDT